MPNEPEFSQKIDNKLIASGLPEECVTWVCPEHHRHCTLIGTDHTNHECYWDAHVCYWD